MNEEAARLIVDAIGGLLEKVNGFLDQRDVAEHNARLYIQTCSDLLTVFEGKSFDFVEEARTFLNATLKFLNETRPETQV